MPSLEEVRMQLRVLRAVVHLADFLLDFVGRPLPERRIEPMPALENEGAEVIADIARKRGVIQGVLDDDPDTLKFVVAHAIFRYGFGTMRRANPGLFHEATRAKIAEFRQGFNSQILFDIFNLSKPEFERVNIQIQPEQVRKDLGSIRTLTEEEILGSQLLTQCLTLAKQKLGAQQARV